MSQKSVESFVGRLATDEDLRLRFAADPAAVLDELSRSQYDFTCVEREALVALDVAPFTRLADRLDPRLQKACLRRIP